MHALDAEVDREVSEVTPTSDRHLPVADTRRRSHSRSQTGTSHAETAEVRQAPSGKSRRSQTTEHQTGTLLNVPG